MKPLTHMLIFYKFFIISLMVFAFVLTNCAEQKRKHNVLVITGGKKIDRENFFRIFDSMDDIDYIEAIQPDANDMYDSSAVDSIDVLVFYDMVQDISDRQKEAFIEMLNKGKGIVFLHHALVSYQEWDEFEKITGGRYYQSTNKEDSLKYTQSTFQHDVEIPVQIADRDHPIAEGINDFTIYDEVYGKYKIRSDVQPLLKTTHPESEAVIGWTHTYGSSRIVYIQLGHDHHAYENPDYRRLIKQSIKWAAEY